MRRKTIKLLHEGKFAAEVPVELIEEDGGWSPYLSLEDAEKLDAVRQALREGDTARAARHARIFELRAGCWHSRRWPWWPPPSSSAGVRSTSGSPWAGLRASLGSWCWRAG